MVGGRYTDGGLYGLRVSLVGLDPLGLLRCWSCLQDFLGTEGMSVGTRALQGGVGRDTDRLAGGLLQEAQT